MEEVWVDAVGQFLRGDEWRRRVLTFVDENCALFADDGHDDMSSFTHAQYGVWHQFKDIVDSCVSAVLSDLGGSEEAFAEACEHILKEKDKGPRDAAVKDVLRKLLTYDAFENFGYMMKVRCQEIDGRVPSDANYFEETDGGSSAGVKSSEDADTIQRRETKTSTVEEDDVEGLRRQLQLKEWEIQIEIAKSITSTSKGGEDSAGREPELIEWAQGVLEMERLLLPTSGASAAEISAFRRSLTILRNKVDLMVARKMLEENDQLRHRLEKDREEQEKRLAKGGDYVEQRGVLEKGERGLDSLLDQHVEKQADVEMQRKICVCYFQDQRVSQESYSEVYFFLKDMVRQENCSFMLEQDEVHDFIFNRLGHEEMTLVPEMLKLLVLEDEEAWLQAHIRSIVSGEPLSVKQHVVPSSSSPTNSTVHDQGTGLQASSALEEAQSVAKRERIEREITEAKMSEVQAESQRVHQELLQQVADAERIAQEKVNAELQTRIDAEVRIRMEAVERERGEERRKLEQERAQLAEETKNLDRRLQRIEEQRIAAEKKEIEVQALQKKAHEVTRVALQKNKELKVLDEHVQQKLKEEARVAAIRERSLEEEEVRLARLKTERQAEEELLKKRQNEQLQRQEILKQEIEVRRKQENDQREEATERLQKEFDLQARDHIENQRKEVERMKEKLAKRLEKKRQRKTRTKSGELDDGKTSTSSTLEASEDVQDAEMKSTLTKARVKELAAALQDQLANTHARKAGADEGKCQEVDESSNSAVPSLLGDLPALKGAQYTRKSESVIKGKMASGSSFTAEESGSTAFPASAEEHDMFSHIRPHADGPLRSGLKKRPNIPDRPGTASGFKYPSHEDELVRITAEAEKEQHRLTLAMQMEQARQREAMKKRREKRRSMASPKKALGTSPIAVAAAQESRDGNSPARNNFKPTGDHRTKNLLDEAQRLRDQLAASLRRARPPRGSRRANRSNKPPPPPTSSCAEIETVAGNVNLSSLRYLEGKFSPTKITAWGEKCGEEE